MEMTHSSSKIHAVRVKKDHPQRKQFGRTARAKAGATALGDVLAIKLRSRRPNGRPSRTRRLIRHDTLGDDSRQEPAPASPVNNREILLKLKTTNNKQRSARMELGSRSQDRVRHTDFCAGV